MLGVLVPPAKIKACANYLSRFFVSTQQGGGFPCISQEPPPLPSASTILAPNPRSHALAAVAIVKSYSMVGTTLPMN